MMKVLYVIDTLEVGGAEKSMLEMVPYFKEVNVSVCHLYKGDQLKREYELLGVKVYSLNLPGEYSFSSAYKKLKEVVIEEKPDLVHTALLRSSLVCRKLCRSLKIPLLGSLVADSYSEERYKSIGLIRKAKLQFFQLLDRFTASWCDHFVAISNSISASNARQLRIPSSSISVIYRGRDSKVFAKPSSGIKKEKVLNFISVGRLVPSKGHVDLIRAFCEPGLKDRPFSLSLVGKGPEHERLQKLIRESQMEEKILLLGERKDVPALLTQSDVFLFPSYYEGLGGALIEAMLTGLPVLCSDIPVFREFVDHTQTGLLEKPGHPKKWAAQISWIIDHPQEAKKIGEHAAELARSKFDIRIIAAQYEQLYSSIYENSSARHEKTV